MNKYVWAVAFTEHGEGETTLGIYSTRKKAIQAVERMADNNNEWLNWIWEEYGWIHAYNDETMTDPAGAYHVRAYRLR